MSWKLTRQTLCLLSLGENLLWKRGSRGISLRDGTGEGQRGQENSREKSEPHLGRLNERREPNEAVPGRLGDVAEEKRAAELELRLGEVKLRSRAAQSGYK